MPEGAFPFLDENEKPDLPLGADEVPEDVRAQHALEDIRGKERPGKYYGKLLQFYGSIGMGMIFVNKGVGSTILLQAEECARSLDKLARENRNVARVVEFMTGTSTVAEVFAAHAPIMVKVFREFAPEGYQARIGEFLAYGLTGPQTEASDDGAKQAA